MIPEKEKHLDKIFLDEKFKLCRKCMWNCKEMICLIYGQLILNCSEYMEQINNEKNS